MAADKAEAAEEGEGGGEAGGDAGEEKARAAVDGEAEVGEGDGYRVEKEVEDREE